MPGDESKAGGQTEACDLSLARTCTWCVCVHTLRDSKCRPAHTQHVPCLFCFAATAKGSCRLKCLCDSCVVGSKKKKKTLNGASTTCRVASKDKQASAHAHTLTRAAYSTSTAQPLLEHVWKSKQLRLHLCHRHAVFETRFEVCYFVICVSVK